MKFNTNWWIELEFYKFYSAELSIKGIITIDEVFDHLSDILNHILQNLYRFCDTEKYRWYNDYWKTNKFHEIDDFIRKEIDKYSLEKCLNSPIKLPYDKIKESLLKDVQIYICDYFSERDIEEYELKFGIT